MEENKVERKKINNNKLLLCLIIVLCTFIIVSLVNYNNKDAGTMDLLIVNWETDSNYLKKGRALFKNGNIYEWNNRRTITYDSFTNPEWVLINCKKVEKLSKSEMNRIEGLVDTVLNEQNRTENEELYEGYRHISILDRNGNKYDITNSNNMSSSKKELMEIINKYLTVQENNKV